MYKQTKRYLLASQEEYGAVPKQEPILGICSFWAPGTRATEIRPIIKNWTDSGLRFPRVRNLRSLACLWDSNFPLMGSFRHRR